MRSPGWCCWCWPWAGGAVQLAARFVVGAWATLLAAALAGLFVLLWFVIPVVHRVRPQPGDGDSASHRGIAWTTADIPDQSGRVAVVTGANGGLGRGGARGVGPPGRRGGVGGRGSATG